MGAERFTAFLASAKSTPVRLPVRLHRSLRGAISVVGPACAAICLEGVGSPLWAQRSDSADAVTRVTRAGNRGPGIQDNSFLIEEAYNQERGVVQHISTFVHGQQDASYTYLFTQEWPVGGVRHQLSYSVPLLRSENATGAGFGDVRLNYRYQLVGDGDAAIAVAPRLTGILPVGNSRRGRGDGAPGLEAWLPGSFVLSDQVVAHANLGVTVIPRARNTNGARATKRNRAGGGSLVWLARPAFNVLLEALYQRSQDVAAADETTSNSIVTISPGIRWAYNFPSGLQIVPGIAVPINLDAGRTNRSVLLYLSFEHPFTRDARAKARQH